jgi:hypothetical protein
VGSSGPLQARQTDDTVLLLACWRVMMGQIDTKMEKNGGLRQNISTFGGQQMHCFDEQIKL